MVLPESTSEPEIPLPLSDLDRLQLHHLEQICHYLPTSSLNALSQTSQYHYHIATPLLYRHIRITSEKAMSSLLGPFLIRRPAFAFTRRITLDCPCSVDFRQVVASWDSNPKEGERQPGPLFEKVDSVVFASTWMLSLRNPTDKIHYDATRHLARLADPKAVCIAYLPKVVFYGGSVGNFITILAGQWPRLKSVSFHGRVEQREGRYVIPWDTPQVNFTVFDIVDPLEDPEYATDYWLWTIYAFCRCNRERGDVRICMRGARDDQVELAISQMERGHSYRCMAGPRFDVGGDTYGEKAVGMPRGVTIVKDGPACDACGD